MSNPFGITSTTDPENVEAVNNPFGITSTTDEVPSLDNPQAREAKPKSFGENALDNLGSGARAFGKFSQDAGNFGLEAMQGFNSLATGAIDFGAQLPNALLDLAGSDKRIPETSPLTDEKFLTDGEGNRTALGEGARLGGQFAGVNPLFTKALGSIGKRIPDQFVNNYYLKGGFKGTKARAKQTTKEVLDTLGKTPFRTDVAFGIGAGVGDKMLGGPVGSLLGGFGAAAAADRLVPAGVGALKALGSGRTEAVPSGAVPSLLRGGVKTFFGKDLEAPQFSKKNIDNASALVQGVTGDAKTAVKNIDDAIAADRLHLTPEQMASGGEAEPGLTKLFQQTRMADNELNAGQTLADIEVSLQNELAGILAPDGTVTGSSLSVFYKNNIDKLVDVIDTKAKQALDEIINLNRIQGKNNDVALSVEGTRLVNKAVEDIQGHVRALWLPMGDHPISTAPLKDAAREVVSKATKGTLKLPVKELETILGQNVVRGKNGWEIVPPAEPIPGSFGPEESVSAVMDLRSDILGSIRAINKGTLPDSGANALQSLQKGGIDALTTGEAPAGFQEAYAVARQATGKMHDIVEKGILGGVLGKETGLTSTPEGAFTAIVGKDAASRAAGSRTVNDLIQLRKTLEGQSGVVDGGVQQDAALVAARDELFVNAAKQQGTSEKIREFIDENSVALNNSPQAKSRIEQLANDLSEKEKYVSVMQAQKASIEKDQFLKILQMNGKKAISAVLNTDIPAQTAKRLHNELKHNEAAMRYMKGEIAGHMLDRVIVKTSLPGLKEQISPAKLEKMVNREMAPLINAFYSGADRKALATIIKESRAVADSIGVKGEDPGFYKNLLNELVGKMIAVKATSAAVPGSNIVLQGASARIGARVADDLTSKQVRNIIIEASKNPQLLKILLKRKVTKKEAMLVNKMVGATIITLGEEIDP